MGGSGVESSIGPKGGGEAECAEKGKHAYRMRLAGMGWQEIADILEYAGFGTARSAAMRHAKSCGLEWPPPAEGGGR